MPAVGLLVVGLVACATGPDSLPSDPATLVLRVDEQHSGLRPWERGPIPKFSLYGGGRVVVPGEGTDALRAAREYRLAADDYRELVADAYAAGLDRARDHPYDEQTDASLLRITLDTPNGVQTTRVTAPEAGGSGDRGAALAFARSLPAPPESATGYQPTSLAVLATGGVGQDAPAEPWPSGPLERGTSTGEGLCTVVSGDDLAVVLRLAQGRRQEDSRWTSGGSTFVVSFRPLLPDERTCEDLDRRV
ncbi:hypothetical protein ACQPZF_12765 [Actinosynnema sp. CS-041913]|uniref:hypothetical protein n=1 Tax=Actinosynnema sp. CS-041913 TaxID=3239917 RepID=UPI003D90FC3E